MKRFAECGGEAVVVYSPSADQYQLRPQTCGSRHCPVCGIRRKMQLQERLMAKLPTFRKHEWKFITLTLRSAHNSLKEQLDHLIASFRRMRQRQAWREHVEFGWAVIEVTWNEKRQQWHPHLHCIAKSNFFPQKLLSDQWKECSNGSPIVDIREIGDAKSRIAYVAKYIGKGPDLREAKNPRKVAMEYVAALKSRRMLIGFGSPPALPDVVGEGKNDCDPDDWVIVGPVSQLLEEARNGRESSIIALERIYPGLSDELDEIAAQSLPP